MFRLLRKLSLLTMAVKALLAVRAAVAALLEDEDFLLETPRMKVARESAKELLHKSEGGPDTLLLLECFQEFSTKLYEKLEQLATSSTNSKRISTQKEQLWRSFHSSRVSDLRRLWKDLFNSMRIEGAFDPLLAEYVNEKYFYSTLRQYLL